jgi:hypothetical protein
VCQSIRSLLTGLSQHSDVASVGFDPSAPVAVHRAVVGFGDDHFVAQLLEMLRHPLALGRGLDEDAHPRPTPKYGRQSITRHRDTLIDHFACLANDPNLALCLVQVAGTILHGWSPFLRLERVFAMWSGSYHVTKEASRFILS